MEIVDLTLLFEEENEDGRKEEATLRNFESPMHNRKNAEELLVLVMRIGLVLHNISKRADGNE